MNACLEYQANVCMITLHDWGTGNYYLWHIANQVVQKTLIGKAVCHKNFPPVVVIKTVQNHVQTHIYEKNI